MDEHADRDEGVRALHRMLAYVRSESQRLDAFEVALLLDQATDALTAFFPAVLISGECDGVDRPRVRDH